MESQLTRHRRADSSALAFTVPVILLTFVLFAFSIPAVAQTAGDSTFRAVPSNPPCYTQIFYDRKRAKSGADFAACPPEGPCDDPSVRDSWVPSPTDPPIVVNLFFQVFCNDDGSNPAATTANVDTVVAALNRNYDPWRIQFVYTMRFVNSTQYRTITSDPQFDGMKNQYAVRPDSQCNIYVVSVNVGGQVFSYATFPWDPDALTKFGGIVMNRTQFPPYDSNVLTHEMGHCLGLWHTHHGVDEVTQCGECYESPGASGRNYTGDLCSDTDPTPTNYGCSGPGGSDPCSGQPWGPTDPQNYMGYGPEYCLTEFTTQQGGRMQCWTDQILTSWLNNVRFGADTVLGPSPLNVSFTAETAKNVLNWNWDFGDGDSAHVQNPSHVYSQPGVYDVRVSIDASDGTFDTFKRNYIYVYADTVIGQRVAGNVGSQVRLDVYAHNYLPLSYIQIPFSWGGPLGLAYDSASTVGLRSDYLPYKQLKNLDPFNQRAVFALKSLESPELPPDTGAIVSLYFTIPADAPNDSNTILIDTWGSNPVEFITAAGMYTPEFASGQIKIDNCLPGDIDNNGSGPDIADLSYLVNYLFRKGPPPAIMEVANCNGEGGIDISDLTAFINFSFKAGPALVCAPLTE